MAITTLLLDIGGVIFLPNPAFWECLRRQWGAPNTVEQIFYGQDSPWGACRTGLIMRAEYTAMVARQLGMEIAVFSRLRMPCESTSGGVDACAT